MTEENKEFVFPDPEIVQRLYDGIESYICNERVPVKDALEALIAVLISRCQSAKFAKHFLLGYISNSWELNDPENDHPDKDESIKIKI